MPLTIPSELTFADFELELDDAGGMHYAWQAVERLCIANAIEPSTALSSDDVVPASSWSTGTFSTGRKAANGTRR